MRCKHLPQDNANVSITYAKKSQKYLSQKSNREEREREKVGISKTQQRNVKPNLYTFFPTSLCGVLVFGSASRPPPAPVASSSHTTCSHTTCIQTQLAHTQLTHNLHTHNLLTHNLLTYNLLTHNLLTHNLFTHKLSTHN